MAGAAKQRANQEREQHAPRQGSSSGGTSSSGKDSRSVKSITSVPKSSISRGGYDGNRDPDAPGPLPTRNPNTTRPQGKIPKTTLTLQDYRLLIVALSKSPRA